MREYEEVVGLKHPSVKASFRRAEQLLSGLPEDQRDKVFIESAHQSWKIIAQRIMSEIVLCKNSKVVGLHEDVGVMLNEESSNANDEEWF